MIILILLGLLQALILPGLICSYFVKSLNFCDRIIFASTLSLLLNYFLVMIMYFLNIYNQTSLIILLIIELLFLFRLKNLILNDFNNLLVLFFDKSKFIIQSKSIDFFALLFISFISYYFYLLKDNGFLTVFTHWDAVVSWNRWAIELHEGTFQGSRGYPLAIPILFSLVYTLANETNIQTFVKYICIYWPFLGGLVFFRCGTLIPEFKIIFGISSIFYLYLLSRGSWTSEFIFSGLVDPIMASYGAISIFIILLNWSLKDNDQINKIILISSLTIATSALIKLTGLFLLFYYLIFISLLIIFKEKFMRSNIFFFFLFAACVFISVHWYVFTTFYFRDWQLYSEYSSLQDSRIWMRPFNHLMLLINTIGLFFVSLIFLGILYSKTIFKLFLLTVIPLFIFCSITVGYDLRSSFIIFAPLSFLAALGLSKCYYYISFVFNKLSKLVIFNFPLKIYYSLTFLFLFLISIIFFIDKFSRENIIQSNTDKRITANNFGNNGNQKLIDIFNNEPTARIISCWQTPFGLPGASGKFIPTGNCTASLLEGWLADPSIKYWLYRDEGTSSQPLSPELVSKLINSQSIPIHSIPLGAGFFLFYKNDVYK